MALYRYSDYSTDDSHRSPLSETWMDNLLSSIYHYVDPPNANGAGSGSFKPVRIAILDSGYDPDHPLLLSELPRIKDKQSFVHQTQSDECRDEIGHGTHALGLLLKVAPYAEIYIAKIAHRETLDRNAYNDIIKVSLAFSIHRERLIISIGH
jgi:subtilisin family serine protease